MDIIRADDHLHARLTPAPELLLLPGELYPELPAGKSSFAREA